MDALYDVKFEDELFAERRRAAQEYAQLDADAAKTRLFEDALLKKAEEHVSLAKQTLHIQQRTLDAYERAQARMAICQDRFMLLSEIFKSMVSTPLSH